VSSSSWGEGPRSAKRSHELPFAGGAEVASWAERDGIVRAPRFRDVPDLAHGFTSRARGSMAGSIYPADDQVRNRRKLEQEIGLRLVRVRQVAGSDVVLVEQDTARRLRDDVTMRAGDSTAIEADALITRERGIAIAVAIADCVPILLATADGWIGIAHAGWKGTAHRITSAMCQALEARGADLRNARAAVGPSIGVCCYSIDATRAAAVQRLLGGEYLVSRGGDFSFDLPSANAAALREAGVTAVDVANICTKDEVGRFFSHRGESGQAGRGLAFIGWRS
jgi:YfiH family protein